MSPRLAIALARELVGQGRPFGAHEVLEARWKSCPAAERPLWQGLAQLCVALTHAGRGNREGAARLWERGAANLETATRQGGPTYGLNLSAVLDCAGRLVHEGPRDAG